MNNTRTSPDSVAVATSSALAADAARDVIRAGGNAVDAAIAAVLVTMNTEPGVCALAGGAFVTIWPSASTPVTIDGYVAVPGLDATQSTATGFEEIRLAYGGGVTTTIGAASVAVPGALAALDAAREHYAALPLADLMAPSIAACRDGFPLSRACHTYLTHSSRSVFGHSDNSRDALHPDGGPLIDVGAPVHIAHLADSLQQIAEEGADSFYRGALAKTIARHVQARGGRLSLADLDQFEASVRPALCVPVGDWKLALNPPPAVGGSMLGAIITGLHQGHSVQDMLRATWQYRRGVLDFSDQLSADCQQLLQMAHAATLPGMRQSASTVHTSAVDSDGLACAITASAGYGSGEVAEGTGLWLNNCLGELELNRRGLAAGPPGSRLPSNMAPSAARSATSTLAIGSPGADRITSAMASVLARILLHDEPLQQAIDAPRLHIDVGYDAKDSRFVETLCTEPGVQIDAHDMQVRAFDAKGMYFGGVGATLLQDDRLFAAADPRRAGATVVMHGDEPQAVR
ncbi:MAG: gamma-glutamyltransferase [Pseudomonadota bacterium]